MEARDEIAPVNPGTYTLPAAGQPGPELLGGFCQICKTYFFPMPKYCPACLGKPMTQSVGGRGSVHSLTVIRVKPPMGLPQPYSVGYVDLDESGLRVFALFDPDQIDEIKIGSRVCLGVRELGHDGRGAPRLRPVFTLVAKDRKV